MGGDLSIRVATPADMDAVYRLVHDAYVREDYTAPQPDGRLIHYPHLDGIPCTTVLIAEEAGKLVGTISITLDGPHGLDADCEADFEFYVKSVRQRCIAQNQVFGSAWRLVVLHEHRNTQRIVLRLIGATLKLAQQFRAEVALFTVNPRHVRVYRGLLGLQTLALGECKAANWARSVLMVGNYRTMREHWANVCEAHGMLFDLEPI